MGKNENKKPEVKKVEAPAAAEAPVAPAAKEMKIEGGLMGPSLKARYEAMFHEEKARLTGKPSKGEVSIEGFEGNPKLMKYFLKVQSL
jgi:hypothetical protein